MDKKVKTDKLNNRLTDTTAMDKTEKTDKTDMEKRTKNQNIDNI